MTTIPDDIAAMVDLLVQNELVRLAPVRCDVCEKFGQCYWHPKSQSPKEEMK